MDFREEVFEMKEQIENVKEENKSFAMQFVDTLKVQNKRLFICWIITFVAFIGLLGYTIWLLNDIGVETQEIAIEDVETIDSSTIKIGDDLWEKLN